MAITPEQRAAALANLYPEAAAAVAAWKPGRLEARAVQRHSSQALCVSVFETISLRSADRRDAILKDLLTQAGVALNGLHEADIQTEVREHRDVLNEQGGGTPTALDGLVSWQSGVVTIESKFTEREFGGCSQVRPSKVLSPDPRFDPEAPTKRLVNCSGRHEVGSDLKPATQQLEAACRLTVRDRTRGPRLYWELAPELFEPDVYALGQACPFCSDGYQLMRNISFALKWSRDRHLPDFAFLVMLVDSAPAASQMRSTVEGFRGLLLRQHRARLGVLSYERLADVLDQQHEEKALAQWIRGRITDVCTYDALDFHTHSAATPPQP
jgi:hypothetical protein